MFCKCPIIIHLSAYPSVRSSIWLISYIRSTFALYTWSIWAIIIMVPECSVKIRIFGGKFSRSYFCLFEFRFGLYPLNANVEKVFSNKEPSFFCLTAYPFSFKQLRLFSSEHMSLGRANTVTFNDVSRSNINVENNPFEIIVW